MRLTRGLVVVSALCLYLGSGPAQAAVRESFGSDSFDLADGGTVVVNVWDVNVWVRAADTTTVHCTTDLHIAGVGADKADAWIAARTPKFESAADRLTISLDPSDDGFLGLGVLTRRRRMGIVMPHSAVPDLATSSGNISIDGDFPSADPIRLRTGDGDIHFDGGAASAEVRTTSGDVELRVVRPLGRLWARTTSGSVELAGGARTVEIETASGDVQLAALSGSLSVESVSGALILSWDRLGPDDTVKVRSLKGDITLVLPEDARPQGVLTTTSGIIHSQFPGVVNDAGDTVTLAGDGPTLAVETASGEIDLEIDRGWFAPPPEPEGQAAGDS